MAGSDQWDRHQIALGRALRLFSIAAVLIRTHSALACRKPLQTHLPGARQGDKPLARRIGNPAHILSDNLVRQVCPFGQFHDAANILCQHHDPFGEPFGPASTILCQWS